MVTGLDDLSQEDETHRVSSVTNENKCLSSALLVLHFAPHFSSISNLFSLFCYILFSVCMLLGKGFVVLTVGLCHAGHLKWFL